MASEQVLARETIEFVGKGMEKVERIIDTIKARIMTVPAAVKSAQSALDGMAASLSGVASVAAKMGATVSGAIGFFTRAALQGTVAGEQLSKAWEFFGRSVGSIFAPAVVQATQVLVQLGTAFRNLDEGTKASIAFWSKLTAGAAGVVAVLPAVIGALSAVAGVIGAILTPVGLVVAGITALVASWVTAGGTMESIGGRIGELWEYLSTGFQAAWQVISNGIENLTNIVSGFAEALSPMFQAAFENVAAAGQWVWDILTEAFQGIEDIWAATTEALPGYWTAAVEQITGAWSATVDFLTGAWQSFMDFMQPTFDFITEAWQGVCDFFAPAWKPVMDTLSSWWNTFTNNFMAGLKVIDEAIGFTEYWGKKLEALPEFKEIPAFQAPEINLKPTFEGVDEILAGFNERLAQSQERVQGIARTVTSLQGTAGQANLNLKGKVGFEEGRAYFERLQTALAGNMAVDLAKVQISETKGTNNRIQEILDKGIAIRGLKPAVQ